MLPNPNACNTFVTLKLAARILTVGYSTTSGIEEAIDQLLPSSQRCGNRSGPFGESL